MIATKTAILRDVLAPWDERDWNAFRDRYPTAAGRLTVLVETGGTADDIRAYCRDEGYEERVANWLVHAAGHLRRVMAEPAGDEPVVPLPLGGE
jgi:hypothetical protein